jgi:hypothetical protein
MNQFLYEMQQMMWCAVILCAAATVLILVVLPMAVRWMWRRYERG